MHLSQIKASTIKSTTGNIMGLNSFFAVGLGAAIGAWIRWCLGMAFNSFVPMVPMGTLLANLIGGYLMGITLGLFASGSVFSPEVRLLLTTGFLGGLTTFSTFSGESVSLLTRGELGWAAIHLLLHLIGSLLLTWLGILTIQFLKG
jgi:fluoride exporter